MKSRIRQRRAASRRGFTLIEIMLVLVILAAVAGIAMLSLSGQRDAAFKSTAASQINVLKNYVDVYSLNNGTYPPTLDALYEAPSDVDAAKWSQVSRDKIKPDPWNNPFEYETDGKTFTIRSKGPDGQSNTEDDITG